MDAFSDINRQQFFGEDPSHYVDEVKQSLAGERGLSPRNRDLVMEVLGRLADRVQSAENSRNAVVNELVSLRERFQVREIEYCGLKLTTERTLHLFLQMCIQLWRQSLGCNLKFLIKIFLPMQEVATELYHFQHQLKRSKSTNAET